MVKEKITMLAVVELNHQPRYGLQGKLVGWIHDGECFTVGTRVRVTGQRRVARIKAFYHDIVGGVVLDKPLAEHVSWNVADLRRAR